MADTTPEQSSNYRELITRLDSISDRYQQLNTRAQEAVDRYGVRTSQSFAAADRIRETVLSDANTLRANLTDVKNTISTRDLTPSDRDFLTTQAASQDNRILTTVGIVNNARSSADSVLNPGTTSPIPSSSSITPTSISSVVNKQSRGINLGIDQTLAQRLLDQQRGAARQVNFSGTRDYRARLIIPRPFLDQIKNHPQITKMSGIVFPYTPEIIYSQTANYKPINLRHTNFTSYHYQSSAVSDINISARFTVQNDKEAEIYISTMYVLKALTRMRTSTYSENSDIPETDPNAGNMPPVCRFYSYGNFLFDNVPVIVSHYSIELPDNVNYYEYGKSRSVYGYGSTLSIFPEYNTKTPPLGIEFAPIVSTITLTLKITYSKEELAGFSTAEFVPGRLIGGGYL